jgi:penicillin amidase
MRSAQTIAMMNLRRTCCFVYAVLLPILLNAQQSTLRFPQLQQPVRIVTDTWGVAHIFAQTEYDLFFAQGFQAATDRLFQFEIFRRRATGTMAEVFGPRELARDQGVRLFRFRGNLDDEYAHYHPRGKSIIQAFTDGINARVRLVREGKAPMPFELKALGIQPGYWTPDVVISRHNGLLSNVQRELTIARMIARYGEQAVRDIHRFEPLQPDLRIDTSIRTDLLQDSRILAPYNAFRAAPVFRKEDLAPDQGLSIALPQFPGDGAAADDADMQRDADGSNNWVISGKRSASGFPLMANDPHRVVGLPSLRYIVHLNGPGWNVIGGGEPTLPGVSIGHNDHGAWGLTIFDTDMEDLYVYRLKAGDPSRYFHKGQWISFRTVKESIPVNRQRAVEVTLQYSVHGPVTFVDTANGVAYAIRCAWLDKGSAPYLASLRMGQSRNWTEFRQACRYSYLPAENMVWADGAGNIGWQAVGLAPIRKNHSGLVPVPGDGRFEWNVYQPVLDRPSVHNPVSGFVSTANEQNIPKAYPAMQSVGFTWADPSRQERIQQVLGMDSTVSMEDMERLQTDWYSVPASRLVPLLRGLEPEDSMTARALHLLQHWDYYLHPDSKAAAIFEACSDALEQQLLAGMKLDAYKGLRPDMDSRRMLELLEQPSDPFWQRWKLDRQDILERSLQLAVERVVTLAGTADTSQWQYGQKRMKHVYLKHPLSGLIDNTRASDLDIGPWPRGGDGNTINSTGSRLNQDFGASFRILVDCADWDAARAINAPGQSGDPSSSHYRDLFDLWKVNRYFPLYFSKDKVDAVRESVLNLEPGQR